MKLEPIVLRDEDGLRLVEHGKTQAGNTPYTVQWNPAVVAAVYEVRARRAFTEAVNFRRFG